MVSESDLVDALSVFPSDTSPAIEGDQDVGPLVLDQPDVRRCVRRSDRLFLWLGRISLSSVRVLVFHRAASGWRAMDSGALHLRLRPGNVQLLRADQPSGT